MRDYVTEDLSLLDGQFSKRYLLLGLRMVMQGSSLDLLLALSFDLLLEIVERMSLQDAVS